MKLTVGSDGAGLRLDRFLAEVFPKVSRATVMKYLREGRARLNGARARAGLSVQEGDDVDLPDWDKALKRIKRGQAAGMPVVQAPATRPDNMTILYEDEHIIVVDKPAGLVMHPGKDHEGEGLDQILREHFGQSVRLVHRIDRGTSGVVVAARGHPKSARRLAEAFRDGDVDKVYCALVHGVPEPATDEIDDPLLDTKAEGARVHVDPRGKPARTQYTTLEAFRAFAWLEVRTHTGRRHQIRAHLQHRGHPLVADRVYARRGRMRVRDLRPDLPVTWKNPMVLARQALHASELALRHPESGEEMTFRAPLPADLEGALELLRGP